MTNTTVAPPPALTRLSEEERLFAGSVYDFAQREVRPLVREMDERGAMATALLPKLFDLGIMGIEIPEEFGGAGATLFHSVLAVEALSRVDPALGVLVDVQNTLVVNSIVRWGNAEVKARYLPRLAASAIGAFCPVGGRVGIRRVCAHDPRRRVGRRLSHHGPQAVDHQRQRSRHLHRVRHGESRRRLQGHHRLRASSAAWPASPSARRKTSSASAPAARASCSSTSASCRKPTCWARSARATRWRWRRSTKAASASARRCSAWPRAPSTIPWPT